ncbi:response regulator [Ammoniphilus sp. YIM 78166]|uniref:response regulator n=1 Tax=Ammoniphilus sp. YIM 78166 TaxID=1644106 RepID=UPI00106F76EC|nr:response regulator [Ammoniphilus sp. YIM 78166]
MRYFITDDDPAIRAMLAELIEDEDLGEVVGEANDGALLDADTLNLKKVDILMIDLLMPIRDGIETMRLISPDFNGKVIMISQVESKGLIGEAYSLGIEYFILKPINRLEVINIIQKVKERIMLQQSIEDIQKSLNVLAGNTGIKREPFYKEKSIGTTGQILLSDLGMVGEVGSKDLLEILEFLDEQEKGGSFEYPFPPLKDIFLHIARRRLGPEATAGDLQKEVKASEQRIRRAILQALNHLASLGLTDYSNPKFETYASRFFDFTEVRKKMMELESEETSPNPSRIHTKKFIQVLYLEAKQLMG